MKQNIFSFSELENIITITKTFNINIDEKYNYFKMLKYIDEPKDSNVLYFPIYIDPSCDGGNWYAVTSDTRLSVNDYAKGHPDYTYVLDYETYENFSNKNLKIIIVPDIMKCIDELFNYIYNNRNFNTILVTGSVGKTTTVGLIESVIKDNVLRIYSKRITPIVLKMNIINYLTRDIKYLIMEAGIFAKHHVKYFSDLLKPLISVCLNIKPEHLGINNMNTIDDITIAKTKIFEYSKYALINLSDNELSKLVFSNNKMIYKDFEMPTNVKEIYDISKLIPGINLYIKTNLSKVQNSAAYYVGKILNIPDSIIIDRLNNIKPVEHRVNKEKIYNKEIIFDGEVSGVVRFDLFTDHFYDKAVLIIRHLTTGGEENEDYSQIPKYFSRFSKVYLFNDLESLPVLQTDNTEIVNNHDFIKDIPDNTEIFYHYGSYYRKYNEFSLDNLDRV